MDIANCGGLGGYYKESPKIDANDYGAIWDGKWAENIWDECGVFYDMGDHGGELRSPLTPPMLLQPRNCRIEEKLLIN